MSGPDNFFTPRNTAFSKDPPMTTNLDLAALKKVAEDKVTDLGTDPLASVAKTENYRRTFAPPTVLALIELAGRRVVPDGWKLVPVEADDEMTMAGNKLRYSGASNYDAHSIYETMLAAAPPPPIQSDPSRAPGLPPDPVEGDDLAEMTDLINRLRGRYAVGPIMANGEPEFGWRMFTELPNGQSLPAIHGEAATALEKLFTHLTGARP